MKKRNNTNFDIEARLFLSILKLKEEKIKEYSTEGCNINTAYVFSNFEEFKSYFIDNGIYDITDEILKLCKMKTTKKGSVIALKSLCDHTIEKYKTYCMDNNDKNLLLSLENQ